MAVSNVLWLLAVCTMMVATTAQCPDSSFTVEHTSQCCDNSNNNGSLGTAKCCSTTDRTQCFCENGSNPTGTNCSVVATTTGPPETTQSLAPSSVQTTVPEQTTTTAVPVTTETTTPPPPLCPLPGPVPRLLNSAVVPRCEENGLVAFSVNGSETTQNRRVLLCHGVYIFNHVTYQREIQTSEYCWTQIQSLYSLDGFVVKGTIQGADFDVDDYMIVDSQTSQGISRLSLKNIMQWYLDNIGEEKGCRNLACMPDDNIRQHIQCSNCFIASYGADNDTGIPVDFQDVARKVSVYADGRASRCSGQTPPVAYSPNDADKSCYIAKENGANCYVADAAAPVFCYTADTNEAVLMAFTVPNENCDSSETTFLADLV
ncbi:uncharacterized protein [Littorina saxatilis]|uniref:uncharacterized protein isoform X3 n=1 Tax=Littorina saxatilis TaxID=31220 RepID=UPI0038B524C9